MTPLLYDLTHLSHRAEIDAPSGIDRVDLMFARALSRSPALAGAVHYGLRRPSLLRPPNFPPWSTRAERALAARRPRAIAGFAKLRELPHWARRAPGRRPRPELRHGGGNWRAAPASAASSWISGRRGPAGRRLSQRRPARAWSAPSHFAWLQRRPDVKPVFFLHDLLPLDYPEFWPAGHEAMFERRIATLFSLARGIVMSSETVADARRARRLRRRGSTAPGVVRDGRCRSPLQRRRSGARGRGRSGSPRPYFVALGTIEPRKNHLALLNLWRAMVEDGLNGRPSSSWSAAAAGSTPRPAAALDRSRALKGLRRSKPPVSATPRCARCCETRGRSACALVCRRLRAAGGRGAGARRARHRVGSADLPRGHPGRGDADRDHRRNGVAPGGAGAG